MASLFGSLLGVANQKQAGQIQGQQTLRQLAMQQIENYKNMALANQANSQANLTGQEADPLYKGRQALAVKQAEQPFDIAKANLELQNKLTELKASGANSMQIAVAEMQGRKAISDAQISAQATQGNLNRTAAAARTGAEIAGRQQGIVQTQSGEIVPTVMKGARGLGNSNANPLNWFGKSPSDGSGANNPASPSTGAKTVIHAQEYQGLKAMGYSDDDIQASYEVSP